VGYDLVIRGGTIVDGSGLPGYRADLGINDGRISEIGDLAGHGAKETIDAEGHVVAPGFIDAHTHMDAQIFWDPIGTCSCWHGVTTAVMGNCGFTLAPCGEPEKNLVMKNLQRAEDISPEAMNEGIAWSWETFPEYLDAIDGLPKGINYAAYMGHSPLRTYVMGERAFEEAANEDDVEAMKGEVERAVRAGALGLSTSRSRVHETPEGRPVASRLAAWSEVQALVGVMADLDAGMFQLAPENTSSDPADLADFVGRLKDLAVESRVPLTMGVVFSARREPDSWRPYYEMADEAAAEGARVLLQCTGRWGSLLRSFKTSMPFGLDEAPVWSEVRKRPLEGQAAAFRDPETRARLVKAGHEWKGLFRSGRLRPVELDWLFLMDKPVPPYRSITEIAGQRNTDPFEVMFDAALATDMAQFFIEPNFNETESTLLEMIRHPRSVVTFSDSGAHVSYIMDSSTQSHMLGYWVRERQALTLESAVRNMTYDIASFWGLGKRGLLRKGYHADIVIFDADTVGPDMPFTANDLPTGAPRLKQFAKGIAATIVGGQILLRENVHTGALPGSLLRGPLASA
jgi:N-acyl-D-aspartate/D-glutamate deacylase